MSIKLWLLKRKDVWYDEAAGFVIRAQREQDARVIASEYAGGEGAEVWLDPEDSTCTELTRDGEPGVVLEDFRAG